MTASELKTEFLIRKDRIASLSGKGYEDNEISSFLTRAQLQQVKELLETYETEEYSRKALSKLVVGPFSLDHQIGLRHGSTVDMETEATSEMLEDQLLKPTNKLFKLPENVLQVVWESIYIDGRKFNVVPITHDEYERIERNKYRKSNERKALRIDKSGFEVELLSNSGPDLIQTPTKRLFHEIESDYFKDGSVVKYNIRYVQIPNNIVCSEVESEQRSSYLAEFLHDKIVDKAVLLALENSGSDRTPTFAQIEQNNK